MNRHFTRFGPVDRECQFCGRHVTRRFARVSGDEDDVAAVTLREIAFVFDDEAHRGATDGGDFDA